MTPDEAAERFRRLREFVTSELPLFAQQVAATDLIALVTNRVVQTGTNYKGASFKPYSTKDAPAYRFWGKSRTQTAERRIRALAKAQTPLNYKKFREVNNLKSDKKNFEFTGEMWRKFGIIREVSTGTEILIQIGGTTKLTQSKIDGNSEREGISIIEASEEENKIIQETTLGWLTRNANRILTNE